MILQMPLPTSTLKTENKVYIQDCISFLHSLNDKSVDLAIIDPPYNVKIAKWDTFKEQKDFLTFSFAWIEAFLPKMKDSGSFYIFNTPYNCALFLNFLQEKAVFQNWITWYKKDGMSANKKRFNNAQESILFYTMASKNYYFDFDAVRIPYDESILHRKNGIVKNGKRWYPNENGKLCPDVWEISSERHKRKINGKTQKLHHPTIKPFDMIERIIKASSKEGDLVLDLFSGSGMTSLVARNLGRNSVGCELNADYLDKSLEII